jgi:ABC-type branched-subunit amino acid transport system substrate-binding protein
VPRRCSTRSNAKGGEHGRKISLVVGDDGYEPDKAVDETLVAHFLEKGAKTEAVFYREGAE